MFLDNSQEEDVEMRELWKYCKEKHECAKVNKRESSLSDVVP